MTDTIKIGNIQYDEKISEKDLIKNIAYNNYDILTITNMKPSLVEYLKIKLYKYSNVSTMTSITFIRGKIELNQFGYLDEFNSITITTATLRGIEENVCIISASIETKRRKKIIEQLEKLKEIITRQHDIKILMNLNYKKPKILKQKTIFKTTNLEKVELEDIQKNLFIPKEYELVSTEKTKDSIKNPYCYIKVNKKPI